MLTLTDILMLVAVPLLLIASGFFSGNETALFSLTSEERRRFVQQKSLVAVLLAETRSLLITLLMSNMVVNVSYFVLTTVLLIRLQREIESRWLVAALSIVPLVMIILFGEVLPKLLASRLRVPWSIATSGPLLVVHRVLAPVRIVVNTTIITPLARLIAPRHRPPELSAEELESLLELSQKQGVIDAGEEELLQNVLELGQLKVRDLMKPRVDVHAFDLEDDPAGLMRMFHDTRLAQLPVCVHDLDHIEGVVHARDALMLPPKTADQVRGLLRPPQFVPELMKVDRLLVFLRDAGTTLAVVVDEYGGTAGLITLEDAVEHLVGHIPGPFDEAETSPVEPVSAGVWRVSAHLPIREWAEAFEKVSPLARSAGLSSGLGAGGVSTIGGLMMARLGRLPRAGDRVEAGPIALEVERMRGRRIERVLVKLNTAKGAKGRVG